MRVPIDRPKRFVSSGRLLFDLKGKANLINNETNQSKITAACFGLNFIQKTLLRACNKVSSFGNSGYFYEFSFGEAIKKYTIFIDA